MILTNLLVSALFLPSSLFASAQDFNFDEINYSPARTVFKLFAPGKAKNVVLNVYAKGDVAVDPKPVVKKRMRRLGDNLWTVELKGDQKGKFYTFNIGKGETPGVFAKAVGVNGKRGAIIDMGTTDPKGWTDDRHPGSATRASFSRLLNKRLSTILNGWVSTPCTSCRRSTMLL